MNRAHLHRCKINFCWKRLPERKNVLDPIACDVGLQCKVTMQTIRMRLAKMGGIYKDKVKTFVKRYNMETEDIGLETT